MKAPVYRGKPPAQVSLRPDGGLNRFDLPENIDDRQASEMLNFWFDRGALRLRPGLEKAVSQQYGRILDVYPKDGRRFLLKRITKGGQTIDEKYGVYLAAEHAILCYDGVSVERVPSSASLGASGWTYTYESYNLTGGVFLPFGNESSLEQDSANFEWNAQGEGVYFFGSGVSLKISAEIVSSAYPMGNIQCAGGCFAFSLSPYIPTLTTDTDASGKGNENESRNLLTPYVSQTFTTDSASTVYRLYDTGLDDKTVTAGYKNPSGGGLSFDFEAGETMQTDSGVTATLDREAGTITFSAALQSSPSLRNNLTVYYGKTVYSNDPVRSCTAGEWYGRAGGSSSVFLSSVEGSSNAVYVSAPGNPCYFPEASVLHPGEPGDPVTAMGKLFDLLVLFKQNSLFTVSDESSGAFTVLQIHSGTGCDAPGSVLKIGNTLAFSNSTGGVFVLRSTQIKDERLITPISRRLGTAYGEPGADALRSAAALSDGRRYFLFCGSQVFVLDYTGLEPSAAADAAKIAGYVWNFPEQLGKVFLFGEKIMAAGSADGSLYELDPDAAADDGGWFEACWRSKAFSFASAEKAKRPAGASIRVVGCNPADICAGFWEKSRIEFSGARAAGRTEESEELLKVPAESGSGGLIRLKIERVPGDLSAFGIASVTLRAVTEGDIR